MRGGESYAVKSRAKRVLAAILITLGITSAGLLVNASPAAAVTQCVTPFIGWNSASGGCDNDGTMDTRLVLRCRVIGSQFEYNVYSAWYSRYTSWQATIFCFGGTARALYAWYEGRR